MKAEITFAGIDLAQLTDEEFSQFTEGYMAWDDEIGWVEAWTDSREDFVAWCRLFLSDQSSRQNFREYFESNAWRTENKY